MLRVEETGTLFVDDVETRGAEPTDYEHPHSADVAHVGIPAFELSSDFFQDKGSLAP
jgi:hypothetical protein